MKSNGGVKISRSVRNVLYYGIGNLDEDDKKELKNLTDEIAMSNLEDYLQAIDKILQKYGFSVRTLSRREDETLTIIFYGKTKNRGRKEEKQILNTQKYTENQIHVERKKRGVNLQKSTENQIGKPKEVDVNLQRMMEALYSFLEPLNKVNEPMSSRELKMKIKDEKNIKKLVKAGYLLKERREKDNRYNYRINPELVPLLKSSQVPYKTST